MNITQKLSIILIVIATIAGCAKENIIPKNPNESLAGRRIRYTVQVVSGDNFSKSNTFLDSVSVTLVMNDSVYTKLTDSSGVTTFNNLASGNISVKISKNNYTTAVYTVDLSLNNDSASNYDTDNLRNSSSTVCIFPNTGLGTAQITGKAFADLDLTTPEKEYVPFGTAISAVIMPHSIENFINHTGGGHILGLHYENASVWSEIQTNGDFSLNVPAASVGLNIILNAEDFVYQQIISPGISQRKIYTFAQDTLIVYPNFTKIYDIFYN